MLCSNLSSRGERRESCSMIALGKVKVSLFNHKPEAQPTSNAAAQAPGIGDFTIVIGEHDARGNPINDMPRD